MLVVLHLYIWYIYLKDTGNTRWQHHISWYVSEAGTRLTPCQHSCPLQPRHPCCKHHKSSADCLSLRNVSILQGYV